MTGVGPTLIAAACGDAAWPANTEYAARQCLAAPVDGLELDVHLSRDGHVVVVHDYRVAPDAARLNGEWVEPPGPLVRSLTLAELGAYDVGRLRPGSPAAARVPHREHRDGLRIPTLAQILRIVRGAPRPFLVYVEIKTDPQDPDASSDPVALTDAVLADIDQHGDASLTSLLAFDWRVLRYLSGKRPDQSAVHLVIPRALASRIIRNTAGDSPWADGCDPRHFDGSTPHAVKAHGGRVWSPYFRDATPADVEAARSLGLGVRIWGLEAAPDVEAISRLGPDSVTHSGPDWGRA